VCNRHLLHRFYQERSLAYDNWKELTRGAILDAPDSQIDFVNLLASYDVEVRLCITVHSISASELFISTLF